MVHAHIADTVERTLRDIMQNQRPFGGKTIVWMGDFKQLLPMVRYGKGQNHTIQQCAWWRSATKLKFSKNWRAAQVRVIVPVLSPVLLRWSYTVPIPLHSILEVLELIMPATMSALAVHNIQMMNDGAFANVRLPSYASFLDALMK